MAPKYIPHSNPWNLWILPYLHKEFWQMQLRCPDEEIILVGTKCSYKYPYERDRGRFNRHTGRRQVTTEAEPRRVPPQTQGPLEPPEAERGRTLPGSLWKKCSPVHTLSLDFCPMEPGDNKFLLFKVPNLLSFVSAAPGIRCHLLPSRDPHLFLACQQGHFWSLIEWPTIQVHLNVSGPNLDKMFWARSWHTQTVSKSWHCPDSNLWTLYLPSDYIYPHLSHVLLSCQFKFYRETWYHHQERKASAIHWHIDFKQK